MNPTGFAGGPTPPGCLRGVDVSVWQGTKINWGAVALDGNDFVFHRAEYGVTVDTDYKIEWAASRGHLLRGAYQFFLPKIDPVFQAQSLLALVGSDPGELPLVLDAETRGTSVQADADAIATWVATVRGTHPERRVLLYGSPGYLNTLPLGVVHAETRLWVAHYRVSKPLLPKGWSQWDFWQYDTGPVKGAPTTCDLDFFQGTVADLGALVNAPLDPLVTG